MAWLEGSAMSDYTRRLSVHSFEDFEELTWIHECRSKLSDAVYAGDVQRVSALVFQFGPALDINFADSRPDRYHGTMIAPPLLTACQTGQIEIVKILLNCKNIKIDAEYKRQTPLSAATESGYTDITKLLLEHRISAKNVDKDSSQDHAKHLAAVEQAMKERGTLDHTLSHGVLVGPARSGKSSLMQRLTGEMPSSTSPSTGVAEQVIQVGVKKSYSVALGVQDSIWFKLLYNDEAIRLMMLTTHNMFPKTVAMSPCITGTSGISYESTRHLGRQPASLPENPISYSQESQDTLSEDMFSFVPTAAVTVLQSKSPKTYACTDTVPLPVGYIAPKEIFKVALQQKGLERLRQHFETSWSLYLTDTGGQLEFQELLPLLVSGPSVFFITFCLHQDLNQRFTIEYHLPDGEMSQSYLSTLTVEEAILQTLASIASMGTFVYKGPQLESVPLKPKVFIIGTHKDMLNQSTAQAYIQKIDKYLQNVIKSTSHYQEDLVEFATKSQLIFTVNNLSKDDSDFQKIRSAVERVVCRSQYQISFPTHWLIFSLVLRQEMIEESVISYEQCSEIAKDCGISDLEELDHALWFLHTKLGLIRHFPTSGLRDIVIRHPQILFDMVTKLVVNTFTFENVSKFCSSEFEKKGIFSFEDFTHIMQRSSLLLPPKKLLELLEHLRIVAPFEDKGQRKFFIPCVLSHSEESQCQSSPQTSDVPPLLVNFECGYCPKGLSGALIVYLLTNEMGSKFKWELMMDQIFRDQVTFGVSPYDNITLKIHLKYLEIIHSCTSEPERTQTLEDVCNEVRAYIEKGIRKVSSDMNLTSQAEHSLSFYCQNSKCCREELHLHPATKISKDKEGLLCILWCKNSGNVIKSPLPVGFSVWFREKRVPFSPGTNVLQTPSPYTVSTSSHEVQYQTKPKRVPATHLDHTTTACGDELMEIATLSSSDWQSEQKIHGAEALEHIISLPQELHVPSQTESDEKPALSHAFRMLLPSASEWQSIGVLLGIPKGDLSIIQSDNPNATRNCLSSMLELWLTCVDPQPTWLSLAEAVECIDPSRADAIRQKYC